MCPEVNYKSEAQHQWTADPCGAVTAGDAIEGSHDFYRRIEAERYGRYAPWMQQVMPFTAQAGKKVLEIGPGLGTDHVQFARAGAETYGIDLTARHLALTQTRFALEGYVSRLVQGDAETLPFQDNLFDVVYSFGVLHHTPNTEVALGEVHRVLRPGGLAIISLYHKNSAFYWIYTIFLRGILKGQLFTKGYGRLLSEIEYRSGESTALPLVKVYSRRQCRRMFNQFASVRLRTDHFQWEHLVPLLAHWTNQFRDATENIGRRVGWYVTVFATK